MLINKLNNLLVELKAPTAVNGVKIKPNKNIIIIRAIEKKLNSSTSSDDYKYYKKVICLNWLKSVFMLEKQNKIGVRQ